MRHRRGCAQHRKVKQDFTRDRVYRSLDATPTIAVAIVRSFGTRRFSQFFAANRTIRRREKNFWNIG